MERDSPAHQPPAASDRPKALAAGYILVVARVRDDAFAALFFESLPPDVRAHVRIFEFGRDSPVTALAGASALVLTRRGIFDFRTFSTVAGWLGIPRYHFLDDNFLVVREEPEAYGADWSEYTTHNLRRALRAYTGVLLASRPLIQYFQERKLHMRLVEYPPITWPVLRTRVPAPPGEPFRVAFFGGDHRKTLFRECVYPAIARLATRRTVEVVAAGIEPGSLPEAAGVRVVPLPYEMAYGAALRRLAAHRIDALLHPTPSSRNNPYKNENVLINARAVGAVPVLTHTPPYDRLGTPAPAVLCDNTVDAWHAALTRLAGDASFGDRVFEETGRYCDRHFSGKVNAEVIRGMLAAHQVPRPGVRLARSVVAALPLELDRCYVRARRRAQQSRRLRGAFRALRGAET